MGGKNDIVFTHITLVILTKNSRSPGSPGFRTLALGIFAWRRRGGEGAAAPPKMMQDPAPPPCYVCWFIKPMKTGSLYLP